MTLKEKTLVSSVCATNNFIIVSYLLILGSDHEKSDINGQNSIHICALNNSIGSSDRILNFLLYTKGSKSVSNILNSSDSNGNLPILFAVRKGFTGFMVHLLTSCNNIDLTKANNFGQTPFLVSIKKKYKNIAGILASYWTTFLNKPIDQLISNFTDDLLVSWKEMSSSKEYLNGIDVVNKIKINSWPLIQSNKVTIKNSPTMKSKTEKFIDYLKESGVKIQDKFIGKCYHIISNPIFISTITELINCKKVTMINLLFKTMNNMKSLKNRDIMFLMIFQKIPAQLLNQFLELLDQVNKFKINESHPVFAWIENGLISIAEIIYDPKSMLEKISLLINLICFIKGNNELFDSISYPILPAPVHEIASCIFRMENEKFMILQLRFIQYIKTSMLWKDKPYLSIDFCNKMSNAQEVLFDFVMNQNLPSEIIEISIIVTLELYNDSLLNDQDRESILLQCMAMLSSEIDKKSMKKQISAWVSNSLKVIHHFGTDYFQQILPIIPHSSLSIANEALSSILIIGSPDIANKKLIKKGIESLRTCAK